ncbi:hypothetical protein FACS189420_0060 [Bacteroidia bacterium]|nr:hypothetical protein FACS18947_0100 [Bacteroidia bacterium]GHV70154.1 hypothetical protein FACS189420_0060 [Bacteroidia bacterium]
MEAVLYDLYIAEGEINNDYTISGDSARKQELFNSVLKKHRIKEAALDSSLAWYSGHLDRYMKINENLGKRFTNLSDALRKIQDAEIEAQNLIKASIAMPIREKTFFLSSSDLLQNAYTFQADTLLQHYGGAYSLKFNVLGITASLRPVVTFCAKCTDTTFVTRTVIDKNGLFESSVNILPMKQVKELYGSIYFPSIYPSMNVFINDFSINFMNSSELKNQSREISEHEEKE